MTTSQLLLGSLIIFIIYRTARAYKNKTLSASFIIIWLIFWLVGLILVIQQDWVVRLANWIGIGRGVDLVIYLSLILLYYFVYLILIRLQKIEDNITKIVREQTLKGGSGR